MPVKKQIFDDKVMTKRMAKYSSLVHGASTPDSDDLLQMRNDIMLKILPLVDAAISRKRFFCNRKDLKQECAVKVLANLDKFDPQRGTAFKFLWTTICNTCRTISGRLGKITPSLEEEANRKEAEAKPSGEAPDRSYISTAIEEAISDALKSNPATSRFRRKKFVSLCKLIQGSVLDGSFFDDRSIVIRRCKARGICSNDAKLLTDFVLVSLRKRLYNLRQEQASHGEYTATGQTQVPISEESDR